MGQKHIRNLKSLGMENVSVCDTNASNLSKVTTEYNVKGYNDFTEAIGASSPDAVLICTPPYLHVSQAFNAIKYGAHVFVEKPISNSTDGIFDLISEARQRNRIIQVGYNFRFQKGLIKMKELLDDGQIGKVLWARAEYGQYLPDWRPEQDYRNTYTAKKSQGGGILLDASHEIDYMLWLLGEIDTLHCIAGTISDLEVDVEDTASINLRFKSGSIGEIHLDFVQRAFSRTCKIVGTKGTLIWAALEPSLKWFNIDLNSWQDINVESELNDKYRDEIEAFLCCVNDSLEPVNDATSGLRTLNVVLACQESASTGLAINF